MSYGGWVEHSDPVQISPEYCGNNENPLLALKVAWLETPDDTYYCDNVYVTTIRRSHSAFKAFTSVHFHSPVCSIPSLVREVVTSSNRELIMQYELYDNIYPCDCLHEARRVTPKKALTRNLTSFVAKRHLLQQEMETMSQNRYNKWFSHELDSNMSDKCE